jgi:hypothetical protein
VALRILKQRLARAIADTDRRLMLECYHPTEKLYTPYLYCNYLYTDSFAAVEAEAQGGGAGSQPPPPLRRTGGLRAIYSHFRPVEHDENRPRRARYSRRQSGSDVGQAPAQAQRSVLRPPGGHERPSIDIYLDDDESFSQLCTITNLVRLGPKPGLFRSHVNVSDGVVRVWRDWLAVQAGDGQQRQRQQQAEGERKEEKLEEEDSGVLWADAARDVGLRFRVTEKDIRGQHPVLVASDEQLPVAYRLEFEELVVRSSTLLAMVEKSEVQQVAAEGKAIVLAAF